MKKNVSHASSQNILISKKNSVLVAQLLKYITLNLNLVSFVLKSIPSSTEIIASNVDLIKNTIKQVTNVTNVLTVVNIIQRKNNANAQIPFIFITEKSVSHAIILNTSILMTIHAKIAQKMRYMTSSSKNVYLALPIIPSLMEKDVLSVHSIPYGMLPLDNVKPAKEANYSLKEPVNALPINFGIIKTALIALCLNTSTQHQVPALFVKTEEFLILQWRNVWIAQLPLHISMAINVLSASSLYISMPVLNHALLVLQAKYSTLQQINVNVLRIVSGMIRLAFPASFLNTLIIQQRNV